MSPCCSINKKKCIIGNLIFKSVRRCQSLLKHISYLQVTNEQHLISKYIKIIVLYNINVKKCPPKLYAAPVGIK